MVFPFKLMILFITLLSLTVSLTHAAPSYLKRKSISEYCIEFLPPDPIVDGRDALIRALKMEKVFVASDDRSLLNEDFLLYLYTYFKSTRPQGGPYYIHATDKDSPTRLTTKQHPGGGTDIFFSQSAGRDLEIGKMNEARNLLKDHPELMQSDAIKITIDYSNSLYESLNQELLDYSRLQEILLRDFKIDINPPKGASNYTQFSKIELNTILKQLKDLPPEITKAMFLKKMLRVKQGADIPGQPAKVVADYTFLTQTIRISDKSFGFSDSLGEGTYLHEMGHAVWLAINPITRKGFCDLSWPSLGSKPKQAKFISAYAAEKNCGEDFAEHFSAYVNQPEKLKHIAPEKWNWIHDTLFPNIEYFSTTHKSAKLTVESKCPDTEAPTFSGNGAWLDQTIGWWFTNNIEYSCNIINQEQAEIVIVIKNLKDDISGLDNVMLRFENEDQESYCSNYFNQKQCKVNRTGDIEYHQVVKRNQYVNGDHSVTHFEVTDKAGNERVFPTFGLPDLEIPGTRPKINTRSHKQPRPEFLDAADFDQNTRIITNPKTPGQYDIEIPVTLAQLKEFPEILLWFRTSKPGSSEGASKEYKPKDFTFTSNGHLRLHVDLSILPEGDYLLSSFTVTQKHLSGDGASGVNHNFPPEQKKFMIHHVGPPAPDIRVNIDQLLFSAVTRKPTETNKLGGDTDLSVQFDVTHLYPNSETQFTVTIRTPSGKTIDETVYARTGDEGKMIITFPLKANHERGEYLIQEIHYYTPLEDKKDKSVLSSSRPLSTWGFGEGTIKILDRGIRKTIEMPGNQKIQIK